MTVVMLSKSKESHDFSRGSMSRCYFPVLLSVCAIDMPADFQKRFRAAKAGVLYFAAK